MVNAVVPAICRDCLSQDLSGDKRCRLCGSPRTLRHAELFSLSIAHIDCDAFYAAVEKRDNPELRDKPVIVGGEKRGVVSTACYIARIHGVHSAMPMFKALQLCPEAVVIKPDMQKYSNAGKQIRERMQELTPLVEPLSVDEAFLDLSGTERLHGAAPAIVLARFARQIEQEIGITVSVGLSYCKFLAKMASDIQKPRGFSVIGREEALSFLAQRPVSAIWGVGKVFAAKLEGDGIRTIGQLQQMENADLMRRYGTMGQRLYRLARGIDNRRVEPHSEAKSVSSETTFDRDLCDLEDLVPILRALSERVSTRLKKAGIGGNTVVLKLKTANFRTRTRNRQLGSPTRLADRIFSAGLDMLKRETDGTRFRLIGIGVTNLTDDSKADPPELIDSLSHKRALVEGAMDQLREKFGSQAVETGYTFGRSKRRRPDVAD